MRWVFPKTEPGTLEAADRLRRELDLAPLVAKLLAVRGLGDPAMAERFLRPALDQLHDPFLMADMPAAVARLRQAIARQEKILIYGDYDVDGTMAVVVLLTALRRLGASLEAHIPHRLTDGYGMRCEVIERAATDGVRLVVSVDTGVRAHEAIGRARELGIDCIVTDHHLPEDRLPPACAILNPHRRDCAYPNKNLCGVGVAFKLAHALLGMPGCGGATGGSTKLLESFLKVVALGTIADVVPLTGENRVIAHIGLDGLGRATAPGLRALIEVCGLGRGRAVTAGHVGFQLAPRLNAAGRMESARYVIDLFTATDAALASSIADRLDRLNQERQQVEEAITKSVVEKVEADAGHGDRYSMVHAGDGWHRGVIGIVAQRIVERYHRPTLVIGVENGEGVGSGRSIPGFHLLNALESLADVFTRFGGHAQAAGFTVRSDRIAELERRFEAFAQSALKPADLEPALRLDCEIGLADLGGPVYEQLQALAPHGIGNPTPVFWARGLRLCAPPRVLKERHLKLRMAQGQRAMDGLAWNWGLRAGECAEGRIVDAAFTLGEDTFQGITTLHLELKDIKAATAGAEAARLAI
jgi:single-stranded-DNA-specific exonuclease